MKLLCAILCLAAVIMLVRMSTCPCKDPKTDSARIYASSLNIWKNKTVYLHPDVHIVPSTLPDYFVLPNQDCVPLPRSPKAGVVICVYPEEEDNWVSGTLKLVHLSTDTSRILSLPTTDPCREAGVLGLVDVIIFYLKGTSVELKNNPLTHLAILATPLYEILWEEPNVIYLKEYLQRFPDMVFVDIGSNIGQYTLFAAAMGRRALAVEMLPRNVQHIQTALRISGLGSEVTIVNNALYRDHRVLAVKFAKGNVGGTSLDDSHVGAVKLNDTVYVHTICMDDQIPLLEGALAFVKMDIEDSEHQALRGARAFFQKVNVPVIQMEFLPHRLKDKGSEVLELMNSSGYVLSTSIDQYIAPDNISNIIRDVYFHKKSNLGI